MAAWTLPGALEAAAATRQGICYVGDDGRESFEPYAALFRRARVIAGHLAERGLRRGDNVAVLIPEAEGFVAAFFGVSCAGLTAVPLAPPAQASMAGPALDSWQRVVGAADVRAIITTARIKSLLGRLHAASPSVRFIVSWTDLAGDGDGLRADVDPSALALIQFTSGSTSRPKGVMVTHENLAANLNAITGPGGLDTRPTDVGVSWLPLFHDMGLIGIVLGATHAQMTQVLMPPLLFLKRPVEWLRAFTRHRATMTFAPNFAYELCVRRIAERELQGLDLSTWQVAGCGAEPIRDAALGQFAARFAAVGFRETAFLPSYGLAEHTLAVSFSVRGRRWRTDPGTAAAEGLERRSDSTASAAIVSCGPPFPGHGIRIDDQHGHTLAERQVGEIVVSGPSVMKGYYADPGATKAALKGGWLRTGDLGYLADGELYVCGRTKDLIIVHGRNYHPQDLEWLAVEVPGVRRGGVVAFGVQGAGGDEQAVLVVESRDTTDPASLAAAVRARVQDATGLRLHEVLVVPRGTVPKTTSGKLQRSLARSRYERGTLLEPAVGSTSLVRHVVVSQWGYAKVAVRRLATTLRRAGPEWKRRDGEAGGPPGVSDEQAAE